jgi:hypothetical protein
VHEKNTDLKLKMIKKGPTNFMSESLQGAAGHTSRFYNSMPFSLLTLYIYAGWYFAIEESDRVQYEHATCISKQKIR